MDGRVVASGSIGQHPAWEPDATASDAAILLPDLHRDEP
jgi:hypothetical protein